ncbi:E3 ubiquitin-protein ligase RNF115-like isoform X2 [Battus philenor]|uniref:E3 ubiquitin-protein ligase RNF115-like isoform X2 n=1 Tax=Battus philenor TaxID=42288 RepID=UPI0035D056B0
MADALVERRPRARFFCHRCDIEFDHVLQDYTCPYCASGFIEQLEGEAEVRSLSGDGFSDANMSNIDDMGRLVTLEEMESSPPMLNDLAFFMTGSQLRSAPVRRRAIMQELIWMIGGVRPGTTGVVTAGAPVVLVGAPGDYVFGGEGLDAVVSQLLGQLENAGPPPLPRDQVAALPSEMVSTEQAAANTTCSICWENFMEGESVSRLVCEHIFHSACIRPWLQLHATCPICRRSLLPASQPAAPLSGTASQTGSTAPSLPRVLLRRIPRRQVSGPQTQTWDSLANTSSSSSSTSTTSSVTAGGVWAPQRSTTNSSGNNSSTSLNSSNEGERQYNMDIDYD